MQTSSTTAARFFQRYANSNIPFALSGADFLGSALSGVNAYLFPVPNAENGHHGRLTVTTHTLGSLRRARVLTSTYTALVSLTPMIRTSTLLQCSESGPVSGTLHGLVYDPPGVVAMNSPARSRGRPSKQRQGVSSLCRPLGHS